MKHFSLTILLLVMLVGLYSLQEAVNFSYDRVLSLNAITGYATAGGCYPKNPSDDNTKIICPSGKPKSEFDDYIDCMRACIVGSSTASSSSSSSTTSSSTSGSSSGSTSSGSHTITTSQCGGKGEQCCSGYPECDSGLSCDKGDNQCSTTAAPAAGSVNGIDLYIASLTTPASVMPGQTHNIQVVVANRGLQSTSTSPGRPVGDFALVVKLLNPSGSQHSIIRASPSMTAIEGQKSKTETYSWTVPNDLSGTYKITAEVDTANSILETYENNNQFTPKSVSIGSGSGLGNLVVTQMSILAATDNLARIETVIKNEGPGTIIAQSDFLAVKGLLKVNGLTVCEFEERRLVTLAPYATLAVTIALKSYPNNEPCILTNGVRYDGEVQVDSKNGQSVFEETDENDNTKTSSFIYGSGSSIECPNNIGDGERSGTDYCDDGVLRTQKVALQACVNNYECRSNVCAVGKCIDESDLLRALCQLGVMCH